jgi:hypothetical protein
MAGRPEGKHGLTVCLRERVMKQGPRSFATVPSFRSRPDANTNRPEVAVRRGIPADPRAWTVARYGRGIVSRETLLSSGEGPGPCG